MGECDLEYRESVLAIPTDLRSLAAELPFHLGLTPRSDGGWEDYAALRPFQSLPDFASEDTTCPNNPSVSEAQRRLYLRAHRRGGFFGLFMDRLADGQVAERPEWPRLGECLFDQWRESLTEATGSTTLADHMTRAVLGAWETGLDLERACLERRTLSIAQYVDLVSSKVAWLGTASFCLILAHGRPERLPTFRRAFDLLLLSSQCLDDAVDHEEDARLHGVSFPTALGVPPGGLLRAAPRVARLGAEVAGAGGFSHLGTWLAERAQHLDDVRPASHSFQNELAALVLGESVAALYGLAKDTRAEATG
ncbi:hypothetical protein SAMN05443572_11417 [Myxococcus fulvus]|uniref:Uncharacterized protein n=1 Tax=Myxococcus fulvus TaxID=33 RepID=A0A511TAP1_MYXFU|nr:hypothetical protein [Myxococcus fulvus]GEN11167.1 hypothetical protein MFU01_62040 [Myxococcus fulvus]SEU39388.1 hypothetical protein SAMN05443572_11417 [Myxococcus fulvus]